MSNVLFANLGRPTRAPSAGELDPTTRVARIDKMAELLHAQPNDWSALPFSGATAETPEAELRAMAPNGILETVYAVVLEKFETKIPNTVGAIMDFFGLTPAQLLTVGCAEWGPTRPIENYPAAVAWDMVRDPLGGGPLAHLSDTNAIAEIAAQMAADFPVVAPVHGLANATPVSSTALGWQATMESSALGAGGGDAQFVLIAGPDGRPFKGWPASVGKG